MSTSSKFLIGVIWIFLFAQLICNFYEGQTMYNNVTMEAFTQYDTTTQTDTLGTAIRAPSIVDEVITALGRIFLFDYSIFKNIDVDPDANGDYPDNGFVFIRYLLIAIGAVMWLQLAYMLFNTIGNLVS